MIWVRGNVVFVEDSWLPSRDRLCGQKRRADGERVMARMSRLPGGRISLPSVFASRLFRLSTMIFSGGFSSVACLGVALRMWFNRKSARRKRTEIGMRDLPAFQFKKPPRTDHRRQRPEKGRRRRRRPGKNESAGFAAAAMRCVDSWNA